MNLPVPGGMHKLCFNLIKTASSGIPCCLIAILEEECIEAARKTGWFLPSSKAIEILFTFEKVLKYRVRRIQLQCYFGGIINGSYMG